MGLDEDRVLAAILSTPNKNVDFYLDVFQTQDERFEISFGKSLVFRYGHT